MKDESFRSHAQAPHRRAANTKEPASAVRCILVAGASLALVTTLAAPSAAGPAVSPVDAVTGGTGVVTTESPLASEAGLQMLRSGGNAIDAAVAAAFAIGVVRFDTCGIGGGGFLVHRQAGGTVDTLDFYERAPGKGGTYTMRTGRDEDGSSKYMFDRGRGVVGVPGFVKGMDAALTKYGTKTLAEVIAPAVAYARKGFPVSPASHQAVADHWEDAFLTRAYSDTFATYYKGIPAQAGELLMLPRYADTLERIAANGAGEMYDVAGGYKTATTLLSEMHVDPEDPSDFTAQDLQSYEAYWREPVRTGYRGHQVISVGGPSSGGTLIVETLNILKGFNLADMPPDERLHVTVEAQRIAWADRRAYYGDPGAPGLVPQPGDQWADIPPQLTSADYANARRPEIAAGAEGRRQASYPPGRFEGYTPWTGAAASSQGTTGISVIDGAGNAVAMSCSLGDGMGSGVTPRGLGFLLNDTAGPVTWDPAGSPNAPAAGKAPRSAQAPTIVVRHKKPILVSAGKGGTTIPMGVLNVILQRVDLDQPLAAAVDAPRIDCCGHDNNSTDRDGTDDNHPDTSRVHVEQRTEIADSLDRLAARGHTLVRTKGYAGRPVLQSAAIDAATGLRHSVSDPRGECGPSSVEAGARSSRCYQQASASWLRESPLP